MKKLLLGLAAAATLSGAGTVFAGGGKPSVAVIEFNNETSAGWWSGGVGWELAGMVSNELAATGSFKVLERSKIEAVLSEQNLAASGRVSAGTGAKIGKLTGAQYLIAGTVSAYEENTASTGGGISFKGISLGGNKESSEHFRDPGEGDPRSASARTLPATQGQMGRVLGPPVLEAIDAA
jgi:curli biogenesis system outer membrane secretion channel CsgG